MGTCRPLVAAAALSTALFAAYRAWFVPAAELAEICAEAARLEIAGQEAFARHRLNCEIVAELAAGRVTLRDAVATLRRVNEADEGYLAYIGREYAADTVDEQVARNLLHRVRVEWGGPGARAAVLARLADEYAAWFGQPPQPWPPTAR